LSMYRRAKTRPEWTPLGSLRPGCERSQNLRIGAANASSFSCASKR
jgi:hypothetical protein